MVMRYLWAAIALQGIVQLIFLLSAVTQRWLYPYDLEWMEGGMLSHAARIAGGHGIYVEPSVEFIPYLYTPLYPGLLAALSPVFGVSYGVARGVSILSLCGTIALVVIAIIRFTDARHRRPAWAGAALAVGLFAATYPWVDGWYDIARADTMFLAMVLGGIVALYAWARADTGWRGHGRVAAAAVILSLSFYCKQTGVLYVAAGGAILAVLNWRRLPVYIGVSAVIGLGGTWLMNRASGGWFWTYVFEVHQAHDCNQDRFVDSFGAMLWKYPAMTCVIAIALVTVGATWFVRRERPASSGPLLVWSWVFAVSCVVGALGFATQWAHRNAYIPAMLTGAIAAGAAVPALAGCIGSLSRLPRFAATAVAAFAALLLWQNLFDEYWSPADFVPRRSDREAGDRLIEQIRAIEGDVLIPFHPWYAKLAGKPVYVHRMGVMDVSFVNRSDPEHRCFWLGDETKQNPPPWKITGLEESLAANRFGAVIWDNRSVQYFPRLSAYYRPDEDVPKNARPRMYTGAEVVPKQIWVPAKPVTPPEGTRALWNFETGSFEGWTAEGTAWGLRARSTPLPKQGQVRHYLGRHWVSSMHGGDRATGVLRSPPFVIEGKRITFRISGGNDPSTLRAELHVDGRAVEVATSSRDSEKMTVSGWDVGAYRGKTAQIVLVDASTGSWGHMNVDEIWEHLE
jgi:hypothetical protein